MNNRTAGVISLIAFLTALVAIVWILSTMGRFERVARIDSVPRQATLATPAYTEGEWEAERLENLDAYR